MFDLSSTSVLITGAGRQPARAVALALAKAGCRLALNDLTPARLDETAALARGLGAPVSVHVGDPSKGLFARGLLEEALDAWGCIDILVNCPLAEPRLPLIDLDEWDFQRTLEANTFGPFLLTQLLSRWLRDEKRPGAILNLIPTPLSPPSRPGSEAFYASQMALAALTAAAAPGLSPLSLRVYAICAGPDQAQAAAALSLSLLAGSAEHPSGSVIDLWEGA